MPSAPPRRGIGRRLVVGVVLVVLGSAIATAALVRGELHEITTAIDRNPSLPVTSGTLASASSGTPQTLLLVGDDRRPPTSNSGPVLPHSNEMLLVRFDPAKPWISMLSIPRDLRVTIYPHHGAPVTNRFNVAYTLGGIQLMTETIKRVVGLSVNHVVVITFPRFKRAVNDLGCVYTTIDRRYYHSNAGLPAAMTYTEVNLEPGYQRVCGKDALEFVGYRHGDTALVRDARDQSFLLDVKKQFGPELFDERATFERIFGETVATDPSLHTAKGLLDLLTTLAQSAGRPVRQVPFQSDLLPDRVVASPRQIRETVHSFLSGASPAPRRQTAALVRAGGRRHRGAHHGRGVAQSGLVPVPTSELEQARVPGRSLPFPLEYPRVRSQLPGADPDALRVYRLRGLDGKVHRAYVVVTSRGLLGQYYDVQGMDWKGAPMFADPDQTVRIGRRDYALYYAGGTLKMVAWQEYGAVYWVRNTLTNSVPSRALLTIAEQTLPVARPAPTLPHRVVPVSLPARTAAGGQTSGVGAAHDLLGIAGFVGLAGVAGLSLALFAHRRRIAAARSELAAVLPPPVPRRMRETGS